MSGEILPGRLRVRRAVQRSVHDPTRAAQRLPGSEGR